MNDENNVYEARLKLRQCLWLIDRAKFVTEGELKAEALKLGISARNVEDLRALVMHYGDKERELMKRK
jgi:hypothetical protein